MYTRAHLSRTAVLAVAVVFVTTPAGADAWGFRGVHCNHDHLADFDGLFELVMSSDQPTMSLEVRAGLSADEPDPASAASIERIRKVEH